MKPQFTGTAAALLVLSGSAFAQNVTYTNFIRQTQFPTNVVWDSYVAPSGSQLSALAIDPGGARFDLFTIQQTAGKPDKEFHLDSRYVGTYVPAAELIVRSEDTAAPVPRTRADRPFYVDITISGLQAATETIPVAASKVKLLRYVQSYGPGGTGVNLDRTQASLISESYLDENGTRTLTFGITSVPGVSALKKRGEERFSLYSLEDKRDEYFAPEQQLSSSTIQIWPVADGMISGIAPGQLIRFSLPQVTLTLNDLYPNSSTYAQVYKGAPQLGTVGVVVPGSSITIQDAVPQNRVLTLKDYNQSFDSDGLWTMELVTVTPFGAERLSYVSFNLDRSIQVRGSTTSAE